MPAPPVALGTSDAAGLVVALALLAYLAFALVRAERF